MISARIHLRKRKVEQGNNNAMHRSWRASGFDMDNHSRQPGDCSRYPFRIFQMALPTLKQTLQAMKAAKSDQSEASYDCLFGLLRASYDDKQLTNYDRLSDQYCDAMDGNDLQQDVVLAMQNLRSGHVAELVHALIGYFKDDDQFYELGHAMISLVFPRKRSIVSPETLTDLQRAVLKALTDMDTIWECDGTLPALLKSRGLPITKSKARQLVTTRIK